MTVTGCGTDGLRIQGKAGVGGGQRTENTGETEGQMRNGKQEEGQTNLDVSVGYSEHTFFAFNFASTVSFL